MDDKSAPTLQMMAMLKIAAALHRDPEIRELSNFMTYEAQTSQWNKLIDNKIQQFKLPTLIRDRLSVVTSRVCLWITQLFAVHHQVSIISGVQCDCLDGLSPTSFLWSTEGLLDGRKTLEKLVRDQGRDVAFRFTLACEFGLAEDVLAMWRQMDHSTKRSFRDKVTRYLKSTVDELASQGTVARMERRVLQSDELPSLTSVLRMLT